MSDSFFTSRNQVDPQIVHSPAFFCEELIEAATRRLIKLEGPLSAAARLQRLSDICSGAYVLPVEHWQKLGQEAVPAPQPTDEALAEAEEKIRVLRGAVETLAAELMKRHGVEVIPDGALGKVRLQASKWLGATWGPAFLLGLSLGLWWEAIWS